MSGSEPTARDSNATGSAYAGEQGMHFCANGPSSLVKANIRTFREALGKRGGAFQPKPEFPGGCAVGALRYVGQLRRMYLLCESETGLVILDQHAAAERIFPRACTHQRKRARRKKRIKPVSAHFMAICIAEIADSGSGQS